MRSCLRIKDLNDQLIGSESLILAFARAIEAKDPYTIGHSERVARFSHDLACAAGLGDAVAADLKLGGLLHDIGKIGVPDAILQKEGSLTTAEFDVIKTHTVIDQTDENLANALTSFHNVTAMGFAHDPTSATTHTAQASGVVQLITPMQVSTNLAGAGTSNAKIALFGFLTIHFVPEPGMLLLLGSGVAGLALLGRNRMRK